MTTAVSWIGLLAALALTGEVAATCPQPVQQGEPRPRRSLAEGLVRQVIELENLHPPYVASGEEMGAGKGPLALLRRNRNGRLSVIALRRGYGEHGPAAKAPELEVGTEEVEEEIVEDKERKPPKNGERGNPAPARPGRPAQPRKAGMARSRPGAVARLTLGRKEQSLTVTGPEGKLTFAGKQPDAKKLQAMLRQIVGEAAESRPKRSLVLSASGDVRMQELVATWEAARTVGFRTVAFVAVPGARLDPEAAATVGDLPEKLGWRKKGPVRDGELLILLDGEVLWQDVAPLLAACARAGIWQLAFVCQKDKETRFKIPAHLPVDRGD